MGLICTNLANELGHHLVAGGQNKHVFLRSPKTQSLTAEATQWASPFCYLVNAEIAGNYPLVMSK